MRRHSNSSSSQPQSSGRSAAIIRAVIESLEDRRMLALVAPALSSLPGAPRTIYLDFVGAPAFSWNDGQGNDYAIHGLGNNNAPVPAYDEDGNQAAFNATEQTDITNIWSWVAEKYSPFKVNVTTVNPGGGEDVRVLIGGGAFDWYGQSFGGVANIGGYDGPNKTCFVWSADVLSGTSPFSGTQLWRFLGESAAHEAGHEWGLVHERTPSGSGISEYYPGDANESPIMGGSSKNASARGIWWKTNVYPGQNSPDGVQDELYSLAGTFPNQGPLTYRTDDYYVFNFPNGNYVRLAIDASGAVTPATGIIENKDDSDPFSFDPPSTSATFTVKDAAFGGMLAPDTTITDAQTGNTMPCSIFDTNTSSVISCNFLTPGHPYFLNVTSQGGYGDIGQYTITGQMQIFASYNAATRTVTVGGGVGNNTVSIDDDDQTVTVGISVNGGGTGYQSFPTSSVDHVRVFTGDGNDKVTIHPLIYSGNPGPDVNMDLGGGTNTLSLDKSFNNEPVGGFQINSNSQITMVTTTVTFTNLQRVELHGALEPNQNYNIRSWNGFFGPLLYIYANGYNDTVTLDQAVANDYGREIYVYGASGGNTSLIIPTYNIYHQIDPEGPGHDYSPYTNVVQYDTGDWTAQWNVDGSQRLVHFDANVKTVSLIGGTGNDNFEVDDLPASTTVSILGSGGNDHLYSGFIDPNGFFSDPFSAGMHGTIIYNGGTSLFDTSAIIVQDQDFTSATTYTLSGSTLRSSAGGGLIQWSDNIGNTSVSLYGKNGGSTVNAAGIDTGALVYVYGGSGGTDTLKVDDRSMAGGRAPYNVSLANNPLVAGGSVIQRYFNNNPSTQNLYFAGYETLSIYTNSATTNEDIYGAPPSTSQTTIVAGANADTIYLAPRDAAGNSSLLGTLGIFGGGGADSLIVDDSGSSLPLTWTVGYSSGTTTLAFGAAPPNFGAFNDIESLRLNGGKGSDTFNVNQFSAGGSLLIDGGAGNDACNFGNNSLSSNITNISAFTFDGQGGSDTFNLNSKNDGTGTYTYSSGSISYSATLGGYFIGISDPSTELTNLYPSTSSPAVNVTAVAPATGVAVYAGSGGAGLRVGSGNLLNTIQGTVSFDGPASASNTLIVSDSADTTGRIAHLTQNSLGAFPGDTLFPAGGSLSFVNIKAGFLPGLTLALGSGADTVYAQPHPTGTITLTGGSPATAPGDTLNLALAAAQDYALHGTASSGSITSSNLQTLSYSGFENGPTVDAVAPAVVNADINLDGVGGGGGARAGRTPPNRQSVDVEFSEDVSLLLDTASIHLTNLTTGLDVPQANIALLYDPATKTAHFTFPGYTNGILPDGNYQGTIVARSTADLFGNGLVADAPFDFFVLAGDANHDRVVDVTDLGILATQWQGGNMLFSQGDFNYDGVVDVSDLGILATNWQTTLPPFATAGAGQPSVRKSMSVARAISLTGLESKTSDASAQLSND